jgi:hypothetical protein
MAAYPAQVSKIWEGSQSGRLHNHCHRSFYTSPSSSFSLGAGAERGAGTGNSNHGVRVVAARNPGGRRLIPAPKPTGEEKGPRLVGFLNLASEIVGGTSQAEKGRKLPELAVVGAEVADEEVTGTEEEVGAEITGARKGGAGTGRAISAGTGAEEVPRGTRRAIDRTVEGAAAPGAP